MLIALTGIDSLMNTIAMNLFEAPSVFRMPG
jgi:hypothetical protein